MENVEEVKKKSKGKESRYGKRYGFDFKLRCVKLRLEEEIPVSLLSKEAGCSQDVIRRWSRTYQEEGEVGLRNAMVPGGSRQKLAEPVREKIVEIKKREPLSGVKRISHLLKRAFFLSASPETVRRALRTESLIVPSKKKHSSNITRPRFFERTTPNQMSPAKGTYLSYLSNFQETSQIPCFPLQIPPPVRMQDERPQDSLATPQIIAFPSVPISLSIRNRMPIELH